MAAADLLYTGLGRLSRAVALSPERYPETLTRFRATALRALLAVGIPMALIMPVAMLARLPPRAALTSPELLGGVTNVIMAVSVFWAIGRGPRGLLIAGWVVIPTMMAGSLGMAVRGKGIFDPFVGHCLVLLVLSALFFGTRLMILWAIALVSALIGLGWATARGLAPGAIGHFSEKEVLIQTASIAPYAALMAAVFVLFDRAHRRLQAESVQSAREKEAAQARAGALVEIDQAKTAFFRDVSHEFRTPITLSMVTAEELLRGSRGPLTASQQESVALIQRNEARLHRLVDTMLRFAALEEGRLKARFLPLDLARLTRDLCAEFRSVIESAGLRYAVDCPPLQEDVCVDPEMWEQIVLNLLSNALKFTLQGEISVSLRAVGARVELAVRDTGVGIDAAERPHIFQRFRRLRPQGARSQEGAGMGLALAQELTRLHRGDIQVESAPGQGSTFTVRLPRVSARPAGAQGEAPAAGAGAASFTEEARQWLAGPLPVPAPEARSSGRVLLVDDHKDMREMLAALIGERWQVETAADGQEALEAARARIPDLILSDVMMPRMDGLALLRALRADARLRAVPVILLSARAGEEASIEGLQLGADDYLVKPFSARELQARVSAHVELSVLRRELAGARERMMGLLAHELRGPMSVILGYGQIVHATLAQANAREAPLIQRLVAAGHRMKALLNDVTDVARVESGQLSIVPEACDLAALCRDAIAECEIAGGRPITGDLPEGPVPLHADPGRISQVLANLLGNALKYSPEDRPISLSLRVEGAHAEVQVRDQGPGIPAEHLPRIFGCFYRVETSRTHAPGLGLGLFLCRELVERQGGTIEAESEVGAGSAFRVRLPLLSQPAGR